MGRTADKLSAVADELICSADLEGYFTDVNPAFTRQLGWTEPELLNRPYIEMIHEDDREATQAAVASLEDGGTLQGFRNRYMKKDGGVAWVDWKAYLHDGEIFAIGTIRPERRQTDVNLESMVTRVVRAAAKESDEKRREREEARAAERSALVENLEDESKRAKLANTRASTWKTWLGAAALVAGGIGGFAKWAIDRVEESALKAKEVEDRKVHVDKALEESVERDKVQDAKLRIVGELGIETQVQVSDDGEYTRGLIRAAHKRQAAALDEVDEPPTVGRARDKAEAIKKDRAVDELFKVADPNAAADPFAGLEEAMETAEGAPK